jgi:GT2 family glycosyltransferase
MIDPGDPPNFRLALKFLATRNWSALKRECLAAIRLAPIPPNYDRWRELHRITASDRRRMRAQISQWSSPPRLSILLSGSDNSAALQRSIDSVVRQIYPNWQLIITTQSPPTQPDPRIKYLPPDQLKNKGIDQADGQYVSFLDPGDELAEHALFQMAAALTTDPSIDILYSDEDIISPENRSHSSPFFKPDWSPEYFLAWMYTGHLAVYRRDLLQKVGGIRDEFQDAFEYDLMLRMTAASAKVHHIPDILYHRQQTTAQPSPVTTAKALQNHLDSTHQSAAVQSGPAPGTHRVRFALCARPLVSIVIPSACRPITFRDRPSWFILECVSSIRRLSTYENIEIIVIDNNDMSADLALALASLNIRRIPFIEKFNLTRKINLGASHAKGAQLILMNDDIEIITPGWIEAMLEFSQQPDIGIVGAQLLFPDDTQQHTGVVISNGNPRHPFYHYPKDHPGYFHSSQVHRNWAAVTGACTMTRAEVFTAVGGYSERFALSYNDIDYCLKVLELGKRVVYTPYAKLYHHESVSRPLTRPDHVTAFKQYWSARFPRDPYYNPNLARHFRIKLA